MPIDFWLESVHGDYVIPQNVLVHEIPNVVAGLGFKILRNLQLLYVGLHLGRIVVGLVLGILRLVADVDVGGDESLGQAGRGFPISCDDRSELGLHGRGQKWWWSWQHTEEEKVVVLAAVTFCAFSPVSV